MDSARSKMGVVVLQWVTSPPLDKFLPSLVCQSPGGEAGSGTVTLGLSSRRYVRREQVSPWTEAHGDAG